MSVDHTNLIFPNHANIGTFFWATVHMVEWLSNRSIPQADIFYFFFHWNGDPPAQRPWKLVSQQCDAPYYPFTPLHSTWQFGMFSLFLRERVWKFYLQFYHPINLCWPLVICWQSNLSIKFGIIIGMYFSPSLTSPTLFLVNGQTNMY